MKKLLLFVLFQVFIYSCFPSISQTEIVIIRGSIRDSTTNLPIANATITDDISSMLVYSDRDGRYSFYKETSQPFRLIFSKEGYEDFERIIVPNLQQTNIIIDVILNYTYDNIRITIDSLIVNDHIYGMVNGLSPTLFNQFKIIIYVLHDSVWFFHPLISDIEGYGFALIRNDYSWRIRTVSQGVQAFYVAAVLVRRNFHPPQRIPKNNPGLDFDIVFYINPEAYFISEAPIGVGIGNHQR